MPGADVKGMLKLNAKKISGDAHAFFFAADKGQDPVLYIDRKFDNPKRFGNVKKIIQVCESLFSVQLTKKTKICVGTVTRDDDGVLNFSPVIQKANAAALKKGLKTFKKEVGRSTVVMADEDESSSSAPDTATTPAVSLDEVKAALKAFFQANKAGAENLSTIADAGIDTIDRYVSSTIDDENTEDTILNGQSIKGKTLAEWREMMVDAQGSDDEFSIEETLAQLEEEKAEVTAELEKSKEQFKQLKTRVERGEVAVTDGLISRMLVDIVKVGDIDTDKITEKMSGSLAKLKAAVDSQDTQREEAIDKIVDLEVVSAKAELKADMERLKGENLTDDERNQIKDQVAQGKMRLEHAEVKKEIRSLEKKVDELTETVDKLKDEASDTAVSTLLIQTVHGGINLEGLKNTLSDISAGLNKAIAELEQAEDELADCRDKERLLSSLREFGRIFSRLQADASDVIEALSGELSDEERLAHQDQMLQLRIEIDQNLADLAELRAEIKEATSAPRRAHM